MERKGIHFLKTVGKDEAERIWHRALRLGPLGSEEVSLAEARGRVLDGDVEVVSRTLNDDKWIAAYILDDGPIRYYLYDRTSKEAQFLFTNRAALEDQPLVKMHPELIRSKDGLTLVSYLSLPDGTDPDGDGRPDAPVPMVLNVHGGPWAREP